MTKVGRFVDLSRIYVTFQQFTLCYNYFVPNVFIRIWHALTGGGAFQTAQSQQRLPSMSEHDYETFQNEKLKDRFTRLVQGWLVVVLAAITYGALSILMGFNLKLPWLEPRHQSPAVAMQLYIEAQNDFEKVQTPLALTRVKATREMVEQATGKPDQLEIENFGWARTTLTAVIGFITGFVAARRVPANESKPDTDVRTA